MVERPHRFISPPPRRQPSVRELERKVKRRLAERRGVVRPLPNLAEVEQNSFHWNERYALEQRLHEPYYRSEYFPLWAEVVRWIPDNAKILELGCGAGQFAALLSACGFSNYLGVDFSAEAVQLARAAAPQMGFRTASVYEETLYDGDFDTIVTCEVLEHVDDLHVMDIVPSGALVVFTVPNFSDPVEHLRYFPTEADVHKRYDKFFAGRLIVAGPLPLIGPKGHGAGFFIGGGAKR